MRYYKNSLLLLLINILFFSCDNNVSEQIEYRKQIPTYFVFQHVEQVLIDSSFEKIYYKISDRKVTKEDNKLAAEVLKLRGWKFYFNIDSSLIFIPNYTKNNEDILMQLYLIESEM